MEVRLCAWRRWTCRCRFDFWPFVTSVSAMRVQPPILVPWFAKQISVVFHNAPSMIMILARVARRTGFSILFPNLSWRTAVFLGGIWRCIACRRMSFLAFVSSFFFFSRLCRMCFCVVREAREVSRCIGQKLMFLMKHNSDYSQRFLSQQTRCARHVVRLCLFAEHHVWREARHVSREGLCDPTQGFWSKRVSQEELFFSKVSVQEDLLHEAELLLYTWWVLSILLWVRSLWMESVFQLFFLRVRSEYCLGCWGWLLFLDKKKYFFVFGWRTIKSGRRWIRVSVEFHAEFHMFPTCVVSKMWKFVVKHCGARGVGMSVDEEVRSWCGTIIDYPLLQEVCESCEHGAENAMWSAFRQHPLLCSWCCGACCVQQCCVVALGNDFVFLLSVVDSWGVFSWCVFCAVVLFLNFYPDPCAVRSKLLTFGLVRCVSWMAFHLTLVFALAVVSSQWDGECYQCLLMWFHWSWETQVSSLRVRIFCPFCVFVCISHYSRMRQMTSRTRWGSHSQPTRVTTIEAFVWETNACLETFFLCTRCVQGVYNFFFFLWYESVFWSGPVQHHFCIRHYGVRLYGAFLMVFSFDDGQE